MACFAAHQAAEKAVNACHRRLGQEAWGHVVARLLRDLPPAVPVPAQRLEQARVLDTVDIPARYPNSPLAGAPVAHDGALRSEEALRQARAILDFVRAQMA